jgi:hypothetical protein
MSIPLIRLRSQLKPYHSTLFLACLMWLGIGGNASILPGFGLVAKAQTQMAEPSEEAAYKALETHPTIEGARAFLHDYPLGKYAPDVKRILGGLTEKRAWNEAVTTNTRDAYEGYLTLYPSGSYAGEARHRVETLKSAPAFLIHSNVALKGQISGQPLADSPDRCKAACSAAGSCKGYDFSYGEKACDLYSRVDGAVQRDGFASGTVDPIKIETQPPAPAPQQTTRNGFIEVRGMDFPGSGADIGLFRNIDYGACQAICRSDSRCRAYTYNAIHRACFIKAYIPDEVPYPGAFSGHVPGEPEPAGVNHRDDFAQEPNFDFPGDDLNKSIGVTYDQCLDLCRANSNCHAFTYNVGKMACFTKWGVASRKPFEGAVSGVRSN